MKLRPCALPHTLAALLSLSIVPAHAVVLFSGGTYSQNFDGLHPFTLAATAVPNTGFPYHLQDSPFTDSTGMTGWYVRNAATNALAYRVYALTGTGGGYVNFGTDDDRALGGISNGSTALPQFGVVFQNTSGVTIDEVMLSFTGEQWRGSGATDLLVFSYQVGATGSISAGGTFIQPSGTFDFTGPQSTSLLDGNLADNRITGLGGSLTGLNWQPGDYLILRWTNSVSAAGLAIDDFTMTAVPEPGTYAGVMAVLALGLVALRRRPR